MRQAAELFLDGETREAAGLQDSEKHVLQLAPTPRRFERHIAFRGSWHWFAFACTTCAGKASFLRDSD